jgi:hypothetical protein
MATQRAGLSSYAGFCILLILAVTITGCTSQTPVTTTPITTATQPAKTGSAPPPVLSSPTPAISQVTEPAITGTPTVAMTAQSMEKVSLAINSAKKQKTVYTSTAPAGRMFLVLDITVKNNAMERGYDLTDDSITLNYAKPGTPLEKSITTRVRGGLENPILMPTTIKQNDTRSGQIVIAVAESSGMYTINLIDDKGAVVSSAPATV